MASKASRKVHQFDNESGLVLDIGIVGAGIAGLTTAATLTRLGHNIYERSRFSNEVGAAVHVGPNAAPVLEALGFDSKRARFLEAQEGVQFNAVTLEEVYRGNFEDFESRFDAPLYFSHRVDLHNELRRLALEPPSEELAGATLYLSSPVAGIDCENGVLTLENGRRFQKDLIIGADGIHSVVARCLLDTDILTGVVNECAYRFLIPTSKLLDNPMTRPLFREDKITSHIAATPDRRLVWYPCRGGEIQNFVGLHPTKPECDIQEDWHATGSIGDLVDTFSTFHPMLVEVCRY
ncbi:FAD binding domain-containing protein [Dactylonectria macrodidyma]|uniref:FAD binding domain-containing protein n=1 Tax=Dactylonectria macrodidyma TaxID=307937 RepID=A0A9P9E0Z3_9HYPO|nr:FAD binding domain-containing protein [Dactylonectria macrodidyma]